MLRRLLRRFLFVVVGVLLFSTRFVDFDVGSGFGRHPLEAAWAVTGLTSCYSSLDYWASVETGDRSDLRAEVVKVANRLGVKSPACEGEVGGVRFASLSGNLSDNGELVVTMQEEGNLKHIGVSCTYSFMPEDPSGLERRIRLALSGICSRGEFYWTVNGESPGRLDNMAWRSMWARVLSTLEAVRRGNRQDDARIDAFSPLLPAPEGVSGANLVIAMKYDTASDTTVVTLASPSLGEASSL